MKEPSDELNQSPGKISPKILQEEQEKIGAMLGEINVNKAALETLKTEIRKKIFETNKILGETEQINFDSDIGHLETELKKILEKLNLLGSDGKELEKKRVEISTMLDEINVTKATLETLKTKIREKILETSKILGETEQTNSDSDIGHLETELKEILGALKRFNLVSNVKGAKVVEEAEDDTFDFRVEELEHELEDYKKVRRENIALYKSLINVHIPKLSDNYKSYSSLAKAIIKDQALLSEFFAGEINENRQKQFTREIDNLLKAVDELRYDESADLLKEITVQVSDLKKKYALSKPSSTLLDNITVDSNNIAVLDAEKYIRKILDTTTDDELKATYARDLAKLTSHLPDIQKLEKTDYKKLLEEQKSRREEEKFRRKEREPIDVEPVDNKDIQLLIDKLVKKQDIDKTINALKEALDNYQLSDEGEDDFDSAEEFDQYKQSFISSIERAAKQPEPDFTAAINTFKTNTSIKIDIPKQDADTDKNDTTSDSEISATFPEQIPDLSELDDAKAALGQSLERFENASGILRDNLSPLVTTSPAVFQNINGQFDDIKDEIDELYSNVNRLAEKQEELLTKELVIELTDEYRALSQEVINISITTELTNELVNEIKRLEQIKLTVIQAQTNNNQLLQQLGEKKRELEGFKLDLGQYIANLSEKHQAEKSVSDQTQDKINDLEADFTKQVSSIPINANQIQTWINAYSDLLQQINTANERLQSAEKIAPLDDIRALEHSKQDALNRWEQLNNKLQAVQQILADSNVLSAQHGSTGLFYGYEVIKLTQQIERLRPQLASLQQDLAALQDDVQSSDQVKKLSQDYQAISQQAQHISNELKPNRFIPVNFNQKILVRLDALDVQAREKIDALLPSIHSLKQEIKLVSSEKTGPALDLIRREEEKGLNTHVTKVTSLLNKTGKVYNKIVDRKNKLTKIEAITEDDIEALCTKYEKEIISPINALKGYKRLLTDDLRGALQKLDQSMANDAVEMRAANKKLIAIAQEIKDIEALQQNPPKFGFYTQALESLKQHQSKNNERIDIARKARPKLELLDGEHSSEAIKTKAEALAGQYDQGLAALKEVVGALGVERLKPELLTHLNKLKQDVESAQEKNRKALEKLGRDIPNSKPDTEHARQHYDFLLAQHKGATERFNETETAMSTLNTNITAFGETNFPSSEKINTWIGQYKGFLSEINATKIILDSDKMAVPLKSVIALDESQQNAVRLSAQVADRLQTLQNTKNTSAALATQNKNSSLGSLYREEAFRLGQQIKGSGANVRKLQNDLAALSVDVRSTVQVKGLTKLYQDIAQRAQTLSNELDPQRLMPDDFDTEQVNQLDAQKIEAQHEIKTFQDGLSTLKNEYERVIQQQNNASQDSARFALYQEEARRLHEHILQGEALLTEMQSNFGKIDVQFQPLLKNPTNEGIRSLVEACQSITHSFKAFEPYSSLLPLDGAIVGLDDAIALADRAIKKGQQVLEDITHEMERIDSDRGPVGTLKRDLQDKELTALNAQSTALRLFMQETDKTYVTAYQSKNEFLQAIQLSGDVESIARSFQAIADRLDKNMHYDKFGVADIAEPNLAEYEKAKQLNEEVHKKANSGVAALLTIIGDLASRYDDAQLSYNYKDIHTGELTRLYGEASKSILKVMSAIQRINKDKDRLLARELPDPVTDNDIQILTEQYQQIPQLIETVNSILDQEKSVVSFESIEALDRLKQDAHAARDAVIAGIESLKLTRDDNISKRDAYAENSTGYKLYNRQVNLLTQQLDDLGRRSERLDLAPVDKTLDQAVLSQEHLNDLEQRYHGILNQANLLGSQLDPHLLMQTDINTLDELDQVRQSSQDSIETLNQTITQLSTLLNDVTSAFELVPQHYMALLFNNEKKALVERLSQNTKLVTQLRSRLEATETQYQALLDTAQAISSQDITTLMQSYQTNIIEPFTRNKAHQELITDDVVKVVAALQTQNELALQTIKDTQVDLDSIQKKIDALQAKREGLINDSLGYLLCIKEREALQMQSMQIRKLLEQASTMYESDEHAIRSFLSSVKAPQEIVGNPAPLKEAFKGVIDLLQNRSYKTLGIEDIDNQTFNECETAKQAFNKVQLEGSDLVRNFKETIDALQAQYENNSMSYPYHKEQIKAFTQRLDGVEQDLTSNGLTFIELQKNEDKLLKSELVNTADIISLTEQYQRLSQSVNRINDTLKQMQFDVSFEEVQELDNIRAQTLNVVNTIDNKLNVLKADLGNKIIIQSSYKEGSVGYKLYAREVASLNQQIDEANAKLQSINVNDDDVLTQAVQSKDQLTHAIRVYTKRLSDLTSLSGEIKLSSMPDKSELGPLLEKLDQLVREGDLGCLDLVSRCRKINEEIELIRKKIDPNKDSLANKIYTGKVEALNKYLLEYQGFVGKHANIARAYRALPDKYPVKTDDVQQLITAYYALKSEANNLPYVPVLSESEEKAISALDHAMNQAKQTIQNATLELARLVEQKENVQAQIRLNGSDTSLRGVLYKKELDAVFTKGYELSGMINELERHARDIENESTTDAGLNGAIEGISVFEAMSKAVQDYIDTPILNLEQISSSDLQRFGESKRLAQEASDAAKASLDNLKNKIHTLEQAAAPIDPGVIDPLASKYADDTHGAVYKTNQTQAYRANYAAANQVLEDAATALEEHEQTVEDFLKSHDITQNAIHAHTEQYRLLTTQFEKAQKTAEKIELFAPRTDNDKKIQQAEQWILNAERALEVAKGAARKLDETTENRLKSSNDTAKSNVTQLMKDLESTEQPINGLVQKIGINARTGIRYVFSPATDKQLIGIIEQFEKTIVASNFNKETVQLQTERTIEQMLAINPDYKALQAASLFEQDTPKKKKMRRELLDIQANYSDYLLERHTIIVLENQIKSNQKAIGKYEVFNTEKNRAEEQIKGAEDALNRAKLIFTTQLNAHKDTPLDFSTIQADCQKVAQWSGIGKTASDTAFDASEGRLNPKTTLRVIGGSVLLKFDEKIVRAGQYQDPNRAPKAPDPGQVPGLPASTGESAVRIQGFDLGVNDYVQSTSVIQGEGNKELVTLSFRHYGNNLFVDETKYPDPVIKSPVDCKLLEKTKEDAAIKLAFDLLVTYDPSKQIEIGRLNSDKAQAERVYAALFHLSSLAGIDLPQSNVVVHAFGFEKPLSTSLFSRSKLPHSISIFKGDSALLAGYGSALRELTASQKSKDEIGKLKNNPIEPIESGEVVRISKTPRSGG